MALCAPRRHVQSLLEPAAARRAWRAVALALLTPALLAARAGAAPDAPQASALAQDASSLFQATPFDLAPVAGDAAFAADTVHRWTDAAGVTRLYLDGAAKVTLGPRVFSAQRATAWVAEANGVTRVFVRFDRMGSITDPVGAAGSTGQRVSVRAMIANARVTTSGQRVVDAAPTSDDAMSLLADASSALSRSLARQRGESPPAAPAIAPPPSRPFPATAQPRQPLVAPDWRTRRPVDAPSDQPTPTSPPSQPDRVSTPSGTDNLRPTQPTRPARPPSPGATPSQPPTQPSQADRPSTAAPVGPVATAPTQPTQTSTQPPTPPAPPTPPTTVAQRDAIFASGGAFSIAAGDVSLVTGETENAVIVSNGVTIQYREPERNRLLQLSAQRAVIFLDPGPLTSTLSLGASQVRGIYLDGEAYATDGDYSLRAPQAYYDVKANKAVALDAVFWTYDQRRAIPLYLRAKTVRQETSRQFTADGVRFSNTAFFDPEISVGASDVTISRIEREIPLRGQDAANARENPQTATPAGETRTYVEADNIVPRFMGLPFFWFPSYAGDPERQVIRDVRIENTSGSGGAFRATLNAFGLLGMDRPGDWSADLFTDFYFERGPALGTRVAWEMENTEGALFAYGLISDRGTDVLKPGSEIDGDDEARGMLTFEQRWRLTDEWTLFAEAAFISDETFVDAFFEGLGETRREFTNRLFARRLSENTSLTVDIKGESSSFLSNEYLLQSQGYSVTKLPEISYTRIADDLLPQPGLLSSFTELRASRMGLNFDEILASDRGLTNNPLAQRALLLNSNQRLSEQLRAAGYFEDEVFRADVRQELSSKFDLGPVIATPFATGRLTAWDSSFDEFSPDEGDSIRGWGGVGVRLATSMTRVYDNVGSRFLDINRLRHIIEPNAAFWVSGTNIDQSDLPIYDPDVEGLAQGAAMKLGVTHTFQTKRGGPGRWHDADVLVISTDLYLASDDTEARSPITRWIDFRPELGSPGDAIVIDAAYNLTDAVALTAANIYDLDTNQNAYTSAGIMFRHTPEYFSAIDLRYIEPEDSTLVAFFTQYRLTQKYTVLAAADYDATDGGFQSAAIELRRQYSSLLFGLTLSYNDITGETSFGFVLRPYGVTGEARVVGIGGAGAEAAGAGGGTRR